MLSVVVSHPKGRACQLVTDMCREAHPPLLRFFISQHSFCHNSRFPRESPELLPSSLKTDTSAERFGSPEVVMDLSRAVAKAPRDMVFLWPLLPTTVREQAAGTTGHRVIGPWQTSWKKVRDFVMEIFLLPSHSPKKPGHPCGSFFLCAANEEICHWVYSDLALFAVVVLKYSFFEN